MLANYLIGLREGLEAALIVGILLGYLVRTSRTALVPRVWTGVGLAVAVSVMLGALLSVAADEMAERAEEILAGTLSLATCALVTAMILWMARNAARLRTDLHESVDAVSTTAWGVVAVAFLAVAREGIETALLLWSGMRAAGGGLGPMLGALAGLATAVALGYLIYRGALRLDLASFFRWTGAALIVVAAGILSYGVHELQEAGLLPGADNFAYDVTSVVAPDSVLATVVRGTLNVGPTMSVLSALAWVSYVTIVGWAFYRRSQSGSAAASRSKPAEIVAGDLQKAQRT